MKMNLKPFYKSKTFWVGIGMLLHVAGNYLMHGYLTQLDITEALTALGLLGLRDAIGLSYGKK